MLNYLELYSVEERDLLELVDTKVTLLRKYKVLVGLQTEEKFLINFSDFRIIPRLKRRLTETFDDKTLKNIIGYLDIDDAIALRVLNKKFKQVVEEHLKELTDLSIYFYETTKVFNSFLSRTNNLFSLKMCNCIRRYPFFLSWVYSQNALLY